MKRHITPVLGPAFDSDQMNDAGRALRYAEELEYYRPRGFYKLARELHALFRRFDRGRVPPDDFEALLEALNNADTLLTDWARRVQGHDYIWYGSFEHNGSVGFSINVEAAREDADLELPAGMMPGKGFSGLLVEITDHGDVTASHWSRGRRYRELFSVA